MQAKTLLIPIAAFALSATGVSAFNSEILEKAGLTQEQISAFETAHELRKEGDRDAARDVLSQAGIDLETMESVREVMHAHKDAMRTAIDIAVDNGDYEAFLKAIEGSPLADIVTSQDDFKLFSQAHELHEGGKYHEAREIMEGLGFEPSLHLGHHKMHHNIRERMDE
jgi:hypothetical protein